MTSSLVGSEMCIRDSPWIVEGDSHATEVGDFGLPPLGTEGQVLYQTVSYTHLTLPTICSV
eukprot:10175303-Prorocentrum_lima.AAC.1